MKVYLVSILKLIVLTKDLTSFNTSLKTAGRIDEASSTTEAYERLFETEVTKINDYCYTDIGMIIMKEVMETATGTSYKDLFKNILLIKA